MGERSATQALEQSALAVRQAATATAGRAATQAAEAPAERTGPRSRPPQARQSQEMPAVTRPAVGSTATEPTANTAVTKPDDKTTQWAEDAGDMARITHALQYAGAAQYLYQPGSTENGAPVSGELVSSSKLDRNPEMAIQTLTQVREAALSPPTSEADLQIARAAAREIQMAQLQLARTRYLDHSAPISEEPATAPEASTAAKGNTDVTA